MAESDESGKSRTATPELNPLLNPLLNKNLGRWAEVYFKCPPDRRDEAVVQLLQELERENAGVPTGADFTIANISSSGSGRFTAENQAVACPSCGFAARPNQKFCGRCGARLIGPPSPAAQVADVDTHSAPQPTPPEPESEETPSWRAVEAERAASPSAEIEPDFLSLQEARPFWYSYRFYIGAVLAIAIGTLGFLAWRGSETTVQGIKLPEQAPSAASAPAPAAQVPQVPPPLSQSSPASSDPAGTSSHEAAPDKAEEASSAPPTPAEATVAGKPKESTVTPMEGVSRPPDTEVSSTSGAQELVTAKEFLDGGDGKQPDPAQAVEWLWKSVSKRNTEATVLLGRLYLRGDGVARNCDQGRVLLDAAAKKGSKDAAFMLQHTQAFGCP